MFTNRQLINQTGKVAQMAQKNNWHYGDSHGWPPCSDGYISCDRLIARALYDLGLTDQPRIPNSTSGLTVVNMMTYLPAKGFKTIKNIADILPGDIILVHPRGNTSPNAAWHTFLVTEYNPKTGICCKYDAGSEARIRNGCYSANVPIIEWSDRVFYAAYRVPGKIERLTPKGTKYVIESKVNKGYCLDVKSGSIDPLTNLWLYKKNKTPAQQFCVEDVKDGYVRIVNVKGGLVLEAEPASNLHKTNVRLNEWTGTTNQLWKMRLNSDMTVTFESALDKNTPYCIDVSGGKAANGTNIWLYKDNGTKAQRWSFTV